MGAATKLAGPSLSGAFAHSWETVGADYANEQHTSDIRRCRFIAPSADLSALAGGSNIRTNLLNFIIVHIADVSALVLIHEFPERATKSLLRSEERRVGKVS